jgi:hypothetical protein
MIAVNNMLIVNDLSNPKVLVITKLDICKAHLFLESFEDLAILKTILITISLHSFTKE